MNVAVSQEPVLDLKAIALYSFISGYSETPGSWPVGLHYGQANEPLYGQLRTSQGGFPGGAVVKNPPTNARDMGLSPGPGRSHMLWSKYARVPQLLSLCSRACKPQLLSPHATTTETCVPRACAP